MSGDTVVDPDGQRPVRRPATVRDGRAGAPAAGDGRTPQTVRDAPPGPTGRSDRTVRDAPAGRGDRTAHDAVVPGQRSAGVDPDRAYNRVNLPPPLATEWRIVRELASGGEADLVVAAGWDTGHEMVVKLHRHGRLDTAMLERVHAAGSEHLVRIESWGESHGVSWEILEYLPDGSLGALMEEAAPPWSKAQLRTVLDQVTAGLVHLHALKIVHRDVKPQNVLVRDRRKLDLVLSDFGLSRVVEVTREMHTGSRTPAYGAPEAAWGDVSTALDWWALGLIILELYTGAHPFRRPEGTWMEDAQINAHLATRPIDLAEVDDDRWRRLCAGLLTRDPRRRWGATEVTAWQRGGNPDVAADEGVPAAVEPFLFRKKRYVDSRELARAFLLDWTDARRIVAGHTVRTPEYQQLYAWLRTLGRTDALAVLDGAGGDLGLDRTLARLLVALDPDLPADVRGQDVTRSGLAELANRAGAEDADARDLVADLFDQRILAVYDGLDGCEGHARLDERWRSAGEAFDRMMLDLPAEVIEARDPAFAAVARTQMLLASLVGRPAEEVATFARGRERSKKAQQQRWFRDAIAGGLGPDPSPARIALVSVLAGIAEQYTDRQRSAEQERRKAADDEARIAARTRRRAAGGPANPALGRVRFLIAASPLVLVLLYGATFVGCVARVALDLHGRPFEGATAGFTAAVYQIRWAPTLLVVAFAALAIAGQRRWTTFAVAGAAAAFAVAFPAARPPFEWTQAISELGQSLVTADQVWKQGMGWAAGALYVPATLILATFLRNRLRRFR